jgi:hypothetical protein
MCKNTQSGQVQGKHSGPLASNHSTQTQTLIHAHILAPTNLCIHPTPITTSERLRLERENSTLMKSPQTSHCRRAMSPNMEITSLLNSGINLEKYEPRVTSRIKNNVFNVKVKSRFGLRIFSVDNSTSVQALSNKVNVDHAT